jgi:hypothetical protein
VQTLWPFGGIPRSDFFVSGRNSKFCFVGVLVTRALISNTLNEQPRPRWRRLTAGLGTVKLKRLLHSKKVCGPIEYSVNVVDEAPPPAGQSTALAIIVSIFWRSQFFEW